ncbi:MAG: XrtA/PEP-CTERM system histidine kinase PrsK [Pseudomonadota bacterium]
MPVDLVIQLVGVLSFLILSIEYPLLLRRTGMAVLPAFLVTAVWYVSVPGMTIDSILVAVWALSLVLKLEIAGQLGLLRRKKVILWLVPVVGLVAAVWTSALGSELARVQIYLHILVCVATLLVTEQVVRNSDQLVQFVAICMGTFLLFNIYSYASLLLYESTDGGLFQVRASGLAMVGLFLVVAPLFTKTQQFRKRRVELSRPMVFSTTSLLIAGAFLVLISVLGAHGDDSLFGSEMQPMLVFLVVLVIGLSMASPGYRAKVRVWLDKHFFATKFDYNEQWRSLNSRLTLTEYGQHYEELALSALLSIHRLSTGIYYRKAGDDEFRPGKSIGITTSNLQMIDRGEHEAFFNKLAEGWIFTPLSSDHYQSRFNTLLPSELPKDTTFVLPISVGTELFGVIAIVDERGLELDLNWEDLDLLKMVGNQVSQFVANEIRNDELVVTRQFEAYHRITAFVMHDLKNLIAQQALVVENAKRFIDNPEFIADAMTTIENSVARMNRLLMRIRHDDELDAGGAFVTESTSLRSALELAVERSHATPEIDFHMEGDVIVVGDLENLSTGFTHLFTNAQEACQKEGDRVDVRVEVQGPRALCVIEDSGVGMDQDFIESELFRPFRSTKGRTGMGIGAYQSRQIFTGFGADIQVRSTKGKGSCFTVSLQRGSDEV